ncbi:hypothetical protein BOO29_02970 [Vibrio navarrensis]|nr:hypothetical protein [Vibrio navarrensis]MBE4580661.1 hypothetical protein [Vibrio navarrensis]MBE4583950.1 hypothetical protein [Vibrio navarrensis]MBE4608669.1 hypothetical protein [Vibrio navarrensis]MBE4612135.1 hypothetical protein [Vibrio navarrensis]
MSAAIASPALDKMRIYLEAFIYFLDVLMTLIGQACTLQAGCNKVVIVIRILFLLSICNIDSESFTIGDMEIKTYISCG